MKHVPLVALLLFACGGYEEEPCGEDEVDAGADAGRVIDLDGGMHLHWCFWYPPADLDAGEDVRYLPDGGERRLLCR